MLDEKASIEAEVPYVFQTENMCLIAGYTIGIEGKLLRVKLWTYGMSMFYISIC